MSVCLRNNQKKFQKNFPERSKFEDEQNLSTGSENFGIFEGMLESSKLPEINPDTAQPVLTLILTYFFKIIKKLGHSRVGPGLAGFIQKKSGWLGSVRV